MAKTVLITGSSTGLGKASAHYFHQQGWNVVATMRTPESGAELASLERVLVARLDVQEETSIHTAIAAGIERFGRIDVLINNAGYGAYGLLETTTLESIRRQFDVNVIGPLMTAKAIIPHFRANASGTIVNISSIGGKLAFPFGALYHCAKFAVEGLSEALQYELAQIGARIKIVEPGGMKTDFGGRSFELNNDPALTEYQPLMGAVVNTFTSMLEQGSAPEKIAEIVYQAATDETGTLRFQAGEDAKAILALRKETEDQNFFANINSMFSH